MMIKVTYVISGGDYRREYDTPQAAIAAMEAMYNEKKQEYGHCFLNCIGVKDFYPEASLVCYDGNYKDYHSYELKAVMEPVDDEGFFVITRIHRDDLEAAGFDASDVDDDTMKELAGKMRSDYLTQLFWEHLPMLAEDLGIPKKDESEEDNE